MTYSCWPVPGARHIVVLRIVFDEVRLVGGVPAMGVTKGWHAFALNGWADIIAAFREIEKLAEVIQ